MAAGRGPQLLPQLPKSARTAGNPRSLITADEIPAEAESLGARGVLRKPLDPAALVALPAAPVA